MSKRRRVFDVEMPTDEAVPTGTPPGLETKSADPRRGPMAAAIVENAQSVRSRAEAEAAIRAENDALAHEHVRLKKLGLIVDLVPLDEIETAKLTRDRADGADPELEELKASIRDIGLSNPIRVEQREDGRYELVQGFRRLSAYRVLLAETGDAERYGKIAAGLIARGEALDALYRRMVDENLVRKDVSFAEMAALARNYAADPGTPAQDVEEAIATLYRSAGRQKRSYIRHFASLLDHLGEDLKFAQAIPRALGLMLLKRIERTPGALDALRQRLGAAMRKTADAELAALRGFLEEQGGQSSLRGQTSNTDAKPVGKTTFKMARPEGEVKCTASDGRVELRLNRDFSRLDRKRLEAAVTAFLDALNDA